MSTFVPFASENGATPDFLISQPPLLDSPCQPGSATSERNTCSFPSPKRMSPAGASVTSSENARTAASAAATKPVHLMFISFFSCWW